MSALTTSGAAPSSMLRTSLLKRYYRPMVSTLAVLGFLLLWEVAVLQGWINGRFTSQPTQIWRAALVIFAEDDFAVHCGVSLLSFALGFVMALAVSIPLGLYLGVSRWGRLFLEPPLMALYTAPRIVLLPILIVWLGIGLGSKVAIVFLGAVFPIMVNTMAGVRGADPRLSTAARAFGATRMDIFLKVLVPGSLPAILMGVRLGVGRGVLSVVVGEMFVSEAGIGHQIMTYGQAMQFNNLLVYAFTISLFGYGLTVALRMLEDRIRSWRPSA